MKTDEIYLYGYGNLNNYGTYIIVAAKSFKEASDALYRIEHELNNLY